MLAKGKSLGQFSGGEVPPAAKLPGTCRVDLEWQCRWSLTGRCVGPPPARQRAALTGRRVGPPPARRRASPSRRLPLKGGVILEPCIRPPITPPLRGSRRSRAEWRRLLRWGANPEASAGGARSPRKSAEKSLDASFGALLRFRHWSQGARVRAKREAGANPARSRHCDQRVRRRSRPLLLQAMGRQPVGRPSCQSGDLPWD